MSFPSKQSALGQFFTPLWVAERLVSQYFPELNEDHAVIEPSCGDGRFLSALPVHVPALGIEIDPVFAAQARRNTGRSVVEGDFAEIELDFYPTHIIGNPPFEMAVVDQFLDRCFDLLPNNGRAGFILPAYAFQTAARVVRYSERWSIHQDMMPRNMFHGLKHPLVFALFTKSRKRILSGFALYHETAALQALSSRYKTLFIGNEAPHSLWAEVIERALASLGGEASLAQIYREIEGQRPTRNGFWKEQIRKVARQCFPRVSKGRYRLHFYAKSPDQQFALPLAG